jgi:hypothetical protein
MREKAEQAEAERARRKAEEEHAAWVADVEAAEALISGLRNYRDLCDEYEESPLITKKGEEVLLIVEGAGLVESRRQRGNYQGGSRGVSIRVAKGVSYRVGAHRGTYEPGPETPTLIDSGTFVVTTQRGVFTGPKHNREFAWTKLVSFNVESIDKDTLVLYMPVTNRQKVSGIGAPTDAIETIHERAAFGVAVHQGQEDRFFDKLDRELTELRAAEPSVGSP